MAGLGCPRMVSVIPLSGAGGFGSDDCVVQLSTVLTQENTEMTFRNGTCTIGLTMLLCLPFSPKMRRPAAPARRYLLSSTH